MEATGRGTKGSLQRRRESQDSTPANPEKSLEPGVAGRNINNLRHRDDTTLMAEIKEELKSLLMEVKEESKKLA